MSVRLVLVLVGTALAVFGLLSFDHEATGPDQHPVTILSYPEWARGTAAVGAALLVAGLMWTRRPRPPDSN